MTKGDPAADYSAGIAVDGVTTRGLFSYTEFTSHQWWKVDLGKVIIFQYARIYPRAVDVCGPDGKTPCGKSFATCRLTIYHYLCQLCSCYKKNDLFHFLDFKVYKNGLHEVF